MRRRTMLGVPAAGLLAAALSACGQDAPVTQRDPGPAPARPPATPTATPTATRIAYGEDPSQHGELTLPTGRPRGVVVVLHGGFWKAEYDLDLGRPLAAALAAAGWAAWNLEYRRVEGGGGAPATFDDVAAGIDRLASLGADLDRDVELDLSTVVTLGHSAGGHLAAWAASRLRFERWAGGVPVTAVISQAGVLDLATASREVLGGGAVDALLGRPPTGADDRYDPLRQAPLDVPLWCVHGTDDDTVPIAQSRDYVAAASAAGADAELVEVAGDHFTVIDTGSAAWRRTLAVLDGLG